jgi:transcriptional/translational regulatory protein YebC/TACO1
MDQVRFSRTVTVENAEKIIKLLEKLEEVDDISRIIELTCAR